MARVGQSVIHFMSNAEYVSQRLKRQNAKLNHEIALSKYSRMFIE